MPRGAIGWHGIGGPWVFAMQYADGPCHRAVDAAKPKIAIRIDSGIFSQASTTLSKSASIDARSSQLERLECSAALSANDGSGSGSGIARWVEFVREFDYRGLEFAFLYHATTIAMANVS